MRQTVCLTVSYTVTQSCFSPNIIPTLRGAWSFQLLSQSVVGVDLFPTAGLGQSFLQSPKSVAACFWFVGFQNFVAIAFFPVLPLFFFFFFYPFKVVLGLKKKQRGKYVCSIALFNCKLHFFFFYFLKIQAKVSTHGFHFSEEEALAMSLLVFVSNSAIINNVSFLFSHPFSSFIFFSLSHYESCQGP